MELFNVDFKIMHMTKKPWLSNRYCKIVSLTILELYAEVFLSFLKYYKERKKFKWLPVKVGAELPLPKAQNT